MTDGGDKAAGQAGDGVGDAVAVAVGGVKGEAAFLVIERKANRGNRRAATGEVNGYAKAALRRIPLAGRDAQMRDSRHRAQRRRQPRNRR